MQWWGWVIIGGVVLLLLLWIILFYNRVVGFRNGIENHFAQLDVQLKRRYDLIPNMIETIKGYTKHESETLLKIVEARNFAMSASTSEQKVIAENQVAGALSKLNVVVEQYPDLKANTNFLQLQKELNETENKIAHFRQFYNDGVLMYNRVIATFPNFILAGLFRFSKKSYLETTQSERQNVRVSFE
jgi:LemA protein